MTSASSIDPVSTELLRASAAYERKEYAQSIEIWEPLANAGHAEACYYMGEVHYFGRGVAEDRSSAWKYYERAGDQRGALYSRGFMSEKGIGVPKDLWAALGFYERAAKLGSVSSIFRIGRFYYHGDPVKEDNARAFELFSRVTENPTGTCYAEAAACLGEMYLNGSGIPDNPKQAFRWLTQAAERDDMDGIYLLGICHARGVGTRRDHARALRLFKSAAEKGSPRSKIIVGRATAIGYLTDQSVSEARRLYLEARADSLSLRKLADVLLSKL